MTNAECAELARIAERAMTDGGFIPYPPAQAVAGAPGTPRRQNGDGAKDLSGLPWTPIDNTESRDLDQIEAVEAGDGGTKLYVGIADVEHLVPFGKANDLFAANNTTSVYTGVRTFPMLPERFSFDLSSLVANQKRLTIVIETMIGGDGQVRSGGVYPAFRDLA